MLCLQWTLDSCIMSCVYAWLLPSKLVYLNSLSAAGTVNHSFPLGGGVLQYVLFSNIEHTGVSPVSSENRRSGVQCESDFNDEKEMYWNNHRKSLTGKKSKSSQKPFFCMCKMCCL